MKKNNIVFVLVLIIFLSVLLNVFLFSSKKTSFLDEKNIYNQEDNQLSIIENEGQGSEIKKITNYEDIKDEDDFFKKFEVKKGLIMDKNTLDNVTSLCGFLEGKNDFMYNKGEKEFLDKEKRNVIKLIESNLSESELKDFINLKNGEITGVYKNIDNFDENNIENNLNYLAHYMLFIEDNKTFDLYFDKYFSILDNKKYLSENYVIPIVLVQFYKNKQCYTFINNSFISY